jgi:hypothetical protein
MLSQDGGTMKPIQAKIKGTMRKIVNFHLDENLDWVADLECGHQRHVAHWVTTPQGRIEHLGKELNCLACRRIDSRKQHTL